MALIPGSRLASPGVSVVYFHQNNEAFVRNHNPQLKPYLKWAGGKRQLLPEIRKHLPPRDGVYYEPFLGAGAVFLDLQPRKAVINDFNPQLILTYRVIRDNVEALIGLLEKHKKNNTKAYYYEIRNLDRDREAFDRLDDTEKAARLIFLNKTCYNGLYRVNSRGLFNVPYGASKNPAVCEPPALRAVSTYLNENDITILCGDFAQAVKDAGAGDFAYFDPPYHSPGKAGKAGFTDYQAGGFDEAQQRRLGDTFLELTARGVKCLLSSSDTEFIRDLYSGHNLEIITVQAKRTINSDSAGRGHVNEVLVKNWKGDLP